MPVDDWKYRAMFPSCSGLWWWEKEKVRRLPFSFPFTTNQPLTLNLELMNQKKNTPIGTVK